MLVGRGALQLESSQHDQIVAHDGKMHVALKVGPTFPETATQTKDAFGRGDAAFNTGPKASQLLVHPAGADHVLDGQSALLRKSHILHAFLFRPFQVVERSKASIETRLARITTVQLALTPQKRLDLLTVGGIPLHQKRIQDQGRFSDRHIKFMTKDTLPRPFFNNVGVFFKERDHFSDAGTFSPPSTRRCV